MARSSPDNSSPEGFRGPEAIHRELTEALLSSPDTEVAKDGYRLVRDTPTFGSVALSNYLNMGHVDAPELLGEYDSVKLMSDPNHMGILSLGAIADPKAPEHPNYFFFRPADLQNDPDNIIIGGLLSYLGKNNVDKESGRVIILKVASGGSEVLSEEETISNAFMISEFLESG